MGSNPIMSGPLYGFIIALTSVVFVVAKIVDDVDWSKFGTTIDPKLRKIASEENSLFLGQILGHDKVIFELHVDREGKRGRTQEFTVHFPPRGKKNDMVINQISVVDCDMKSDGLPPILMSGGINQTHATIFLKSQPSKDLDYLVMIRGVEKGQPTVDNSPKTTRSPRRKKKSRNE